MDKERRQTDKTVYTVRQSKEQADRTVYTVRLSTEQTRRMKSGRTTHAEATKVYRKLWRESST